MKGELDWITLKALAKERDRRYDTASALARDIERFLNHEPVSAGPPTGGYRLRKFVRRHRGQVLAAGLVLGALVAGVIGTSAGFVQADRKRREAERNLAYARKGNEILGSVFAGLDPQKNFESVGEFSKVLADNLRQAVKELEGSAIGDPLELAAMQVTLGKSLLGLGESGLAVEVLEKARETRRSRLGPDHPDTLESMSTLTESYRASGDFVKALRMHEETLELSRAKLGLDHLQTLGSMNNLAVIYRAAGEFAKVLPLAEEELAHTKAKLGPTHPDTFLSMNNLAMSYREAGDLTKALSLLEQALGLIEKKLGRPHPEAQRVVANLGSTYLSANRLADALLLLEEALPASRRDPRIRWVPGDLLKAYARTGRRDKGVALMAEMEADVRRETPDESPARAARLAAGSLILMQFRAFAETERLLREALAIREKAEPDVWTTFYTMSMLGGALLGQE